VGLPVEARADGVELLVGEPERAVQRLVFRRQNALVQPGRLSGAADELLLRDRHAGAPVTSAGSRPSARSAADSMSDRMMSRPSSEPSTASTAASGWGIRPHTLPA